MDGERVQGEEDAASGFRSPGFPPIRERMRTRPIAFSVHLLTASGAALALMALVAAGAGNWVQMFGWLGLAFIVDGIDGPLARAVDIKKNAANWDGVVLDLVIDYLTYVFIPAYALIYSGILPYEWGLGAALLVALTGGFYFADVRMKNPDNTFSGFPACWQMVVLVLMTLQPAVWATMTLIVVLALAQFVPLKFIHPVRTERWRGVNLPMTLAWVGFAGWSAWEGFDPPQACHAGLLWTSVWILGIGIVMQAFPERRGPERSA
jgi:phosphatidylcholine synthase